MDRGWIRSAAISCAFASCAMVAGPGLLGAAVAHAGLGIGPHVDIDVLDLFGKDGDDKKKSDLHHPRPGAGVTAQTSRSTAGLAAAEAAPTAKVATAQQPVARNVAPRASTSSGGGGGGVPAATTIPSRAGSLPPVPSAPVTRSVVIRAPRSVAAPTLPQAPSVVALASPPPVPVAPDGRPAPAGPVAPSPHSPRAKEPVAPDNSGATHVPDSYRAGYAEHLRAATTTDLLLAALPGVAGIAGFTLVGVYAGYRQARGVQTALQAPAPTSILL